MIRCLSESEVKGHRSSEAADLHCAVENKAGKRKMRDSFLYNRASRIGDYQQALVEGESLPN